MPIGKQPEDKSIPFVYDGEAGKIFYIWFVTILLSSITLGIYKFWGKTRMRKYLARTIAIEGERFEYTGTGGELFKGFLIALPILIGLTVAFATEIIAVVLLALFAFFLLLFAAQYGAMRYLLSRTHWRGIRGQLEGSRWTFVWLCVYRTFLDIITLGILVPKSDQVIWKYMVDNASFGSQKMKFDINMQGLMTLHIVTLLLTPFTFGIARIWYMAEAHNRRFNGLKIGAIGFSSRYTGGGYCMLMLTNALLLIVTLGIGAPLIIHRNMKYFCDNKAVVSNIETTGILQATGNMERYGEGLEDVLDAESDLGFAI